MEETLKPCPFCGAEAEIVRNSSGSYFVRCTNKQCAAKTRLYHENEVGPRLAWNKRVERTCSPVFGECSECKYPLHDHARYCSNCGARIKAVDE